MYWVDVLVGNATAAEDFLAFCDREIAACVIEAEEAVCKKDSAVEAAAAFGRKKGFETVRNKVVGHVREENQYESFQQKVRGSKGGKRE